MLLTLIILLIFTCRARSRRLSVCRLWPQLNWWSMYMPGHYFASRFLKEIWIIVILIFCDWTSQPQNVQFMFYEFQPRLWKVYSFKNCVAELIKSNLRLSFGTCNKKLLVLYHAAFSIKQNILTVHFKVPKRNIWLILDLQLLFQLPWF